MSKLDLQVGLQLEYQPWQNLALHKMIITTQMWEISLSSVSTDRSRCTPIPGLYMWTLYFRSSTLEVFNQYIKVYKGKCIVIWSESLYLTINGGFYLEFPYELLRIAEICNPSLDPFPSPLRRNTGGWEEWGVVVFSRYRATVLGADTMHMGWLVLTVWSV